MVNTSPGSRRLRRDIGSVANAQDKLRQSSYSEEFGQEDPQFGQFDKLIHERGGESDVGSNEV